LDFLFLLNYLWPEFDVALFYRAIVGVINHLTIIIFNLISACWKTQMYITFTQPVP